MSKRTLHTYASLLHGANAVAKALQAYYTLWGSQEHSPNICKPPTRFAEFKTHFPNLCIHASYTLCGSQNALYELLQASHTLCGGQNVPCKVLHASYTLCGGQNALSIALEASYTFYGG